MRKKLLGTILAISIIGSTPVLAQNTVSQSPATQSGDVTIDNPFAAKVPNEVILVKGAVTGSTDSSVPAPENGNIVENIYSNRYFGLSYTLPAGFSQKYAGPPPSDSGYYVLMQLVPKAEFESAAPGSVLVSAQDLFFGLVPADNPLALVEFRRSKLGPDFKVERQPVQLKMGTHSFIRFDYMSPAAGLHWYTLTTQVRCHAVQFQFTSRDPELAEAMVKQLEKMSITDAADNSLAAAPVCIKDYATGDKVLQKVAPELTGHRFNRIPVRIVIDRYGKVKYVHVISGFPDEIKSVTEALLKWEFRPYRVNGKAVEVETGILFGAQPVQGNSATAAVRVAD